MLGESVTTEAADANRRGAKTGTEKKNGEKKSLGKQHRRKWESFFYFSSGANESRRRLFSKSRTKTVAGNKIRAKSVCKRVDLQSLGKRMKQKCDVIHYSSSFFLSPTRSSKQTITLSSLWRPEHRILGQDIELFSRAWKCSMREKKARVREPKEQWYREHNEL